MSNLKHRLDGYELLKGNGLEIGALNQPAAIPPRCKIDYCDALPKEEAIKLFPELNVNDLVDVKYVCDLDKKGLSTFDENTFDFVILNHVIEHVANPINVIEELFRITLDGGFVIISAPDKNYTFDKNRLLTPFSHLLEESGNNVTEVTDEHYIDFLRGVHPEVFHRSQEEIRRSIDNVKRRREHAHVWNSETFKEFLVMSLDMLNIKAACLFESTGEENHVEYFSVWKKTLESDTKMAISVSIIEKLRYYMRRLSHKKRWFCDL